MIYYEDIMDTTIEKIPTWALSGLINDDWTGINDDEYEMVANWLSTNRLCVMAPVDYTEYFSSVPAFGKACMVMDCVCETF